MSSEFYICLILNKCERIVDSYNELINSLNFRNENEVDTNDNNNNNENENNLTVKQRNEINRQIEIAKYKFNTDFSNIIDYDEKINNGNYREFANSQLELLFNTYSGIIKNINKLKRD